MMRLTKLTTTLLLVGAMAVGTASTLGCDEQADGSVFPAKAEFHVRDVDQSAEQRAELIADIEAARESIDIAVSTLLDEEVAQALIDARARGVAVRVVSDWDSRDSAGLVQLEDNDIIPVYGDGALQYLPEPTLNSLLSICLYDPHEVKCSTQLEACLGGAASEDCFTPEEGLMQRPGSFNLMSHNFAVIDEDVVWNFPALDQATRNWIGWRAKSSQLAYDFSREFQQMHGGVFSTTLSIYNGPLKSSTDYRVRYLTDEGILKVWFNPQERLMKTVIDEVYKARASVWVMSDTLSNPHLVDALEYKANNGFDVRVLVHPDHQASGDIQDRLEDLGVRYAPATYEHLSTLLIIDAEKDREGRKWGRHVMGLSHPLLHGSPFEVEYKKPDDEIYIYPSDLFADGNLWLIDEKGANTHDFTLNDRFVDQWRNLWEAAQ
ncbi:hypothetical protein FIV42_12060 [Persicimonas caeni]|uniref:phospholipase D n=1 Tax=Persicimonas caeni TaxID=2292766 RepID=A0A4Y6PT10_PERCE|nr:phospholipase D-like domain-containing protein [Persicimonas caeni]QDG51451.1 hypothetical protein FIV42_12060 [Persicimonas caeni]QED32672.1 hypothetical protein FRD00_12055 [Persicimonas caeni]